MARKPKINMRDIPHKFDPDEGLFYERVFSPEKVKVETVEEKTAKKPKKIVKLTLTDKRGYKIEVEGGRLVRIVCRLLRPWTSFDLASQLYALRNDPKKLEEALNQALQTSKRSFKAYFDGEGQVNGIASEIHKQISWKKIRKLIENAIQTAFGTVVPEGSPLHPNKWTYQMPINDPNVSAWLTIHPGNNIVKGRSGIRVWSRFRTERGGLKRPACLNWCGMWEVPLQFFGVKTERLDEIPNIELLNMQQFHLANAIEDQRQFEQELVTKMEGMKVIIKKGILPIVKESRKVYLSKTEMKAILEAYSEKVALPKYIVKQIMEHVQEQTVWGFSQAVSWVRTHGEFDEKKSKLPKEERRLVQNLENIAGEVLSIAPTIAKLHKALGRGNITKKALMTPQKIRNPQLKAMAV